MIFSKANKIPDGLDYDKTVSKLLKLGWLSEIFDVESNKSVYQITDLGYQYYFTICLTTGNERLFNGPKLVIVVASQYIFEEGYVIPVRDGQKLTPTGAEYLCVLIDAHDKEIRTGGKNKKTSKSGTVKKIGKYSAMFMRGLNKASEIAQEYDKQSTIATRKYWVKDKKGACPNCNHINSPKSKFCVKCGNSIKGKDKGVCPTCDYINSPKSKFCVKCGNSLKGKDKSSSRKRTSASKRKARYNKRKSNIKKRRKKHTDTTKSEILGGFDFKDIGDKMMK